MDFLVHAAIALIATWVLFWYSMKVGLVAVLVCLAQTCSLLVAGVVLAIACINGSLLVELLMFPVAVGCLSLIPFADTMYDELLDIEVSFRDNRLEIERLLNKLGMNSDESPCNEGSKC